MSVGAAIGAIARSVVSKGLLATFRLCVGSLLYRVSPPLFLRYRDTLMDREDRRFDRKHGTMTSRASVLTAGGEPVRRGTGYHPAAEAEFREMLTRLPIRYEEHTFVDIGAGVGKTLLMASEWPFHRIVGVELGDRLVSVARDNIAAYRSSRQKCHDISVMHADALEYELPTDPTVLFLFNPFGGLTMGRFVDRVRLQRSAAGQLHVIYYNPQHPEHFAADAFAPVACGLGLQGRYRIYRWVG